MNAAQRQQPAAQQQSRFPWEANGITFNSRAELENIIERFANEGSKRFLAAAKTLLSQAMAAHKLTYDQANDLKKRLHL